MVSVLAVLAVMGAAYVGVLFWAARRESQRFRLVGPLLMLRTRAGKRTLSRIAKQRWWGRAADVFIALTVVAGLLMVVLVVWQNTLLFTHTEAVREEPPQVEQALAIPGVNPVIPIGYGIFALLVALVIHEGGHGVMCRFSKLRVKSLGLLFFVVPIGAFVEPDEAELQGASLREKLRMFAAGPGPNMVLGAACVVLFSQAMLPALAVSNEGIAMMSVSEGLPAEAAGVQEGEFVTHVAYRNATLTDEARDKLEERYPGAAWSWNHTEGPASEDPDASPTSRTLNLTYTTPTGQQGTVEVQPMDRHRWYAEHAPDDNREAYRDQPLVLGFQETRVRTIEAFQTTLDASFPAADWSFNHTAGPAADDPDASPHPIRVELTLERDGTTRTVELEPTDRYLHLEEVAPDANTDENKDQPFLGVGPADADRLEGILGNLISPFENQGIQGAIFYLALPFINLQPFPGAFHEIFTATGIFAGWGSAFWVTANSLYWLFWLNVVLGTFNALPMGPLDGGHMFRHSLHAWLRKRRGLEEDDLRVLETEETGPTFVARTPDLQEVLDGVDRDVRWINGTVGFTLLGLLLAPLVIPYFL
jgi:membrane-associated protease RseP (regulator of RpoE activity)